MIVATEGLYAERARIFSKFGKGLVGTISAAFFACFLILHWETALVASSMCLYTAREIFRVYSRVKKVRRSYSRLHLKNR